VRKRTIIVVISLISAFILMSGGYGYWQKPLIITGKIKVVEPPPPTVYADAPKINEILELKQPVLVDSEASNNLGENETEDMLPEEVIEAVDNPQVIDSAPIDQAADIEDKNSESIVNVVQEQDENEVVEGENTGEISMPTSEEVEDVKSNITE
jgi:hypothetical protein